MKINYYAMPEIKDLEEKDVEVRFPGSKKEIIILIICEWFDVPREQLNKRSRLRKYVIPRQICMYFLKQYTTMSLKEIGVVFGGRDHATAIHSIKTIKELMFYDEFKKDINLIDYKIIRKLFDGHMNVSNINQKQFTL